MISCSSTQRMKKDRPCEFSIPHGLSSFLKRRKVFCKNSSASKAQDKMMMPAPQRRWQQRSRLSLSFFSSLSFSPSPGHVLSPEAGREEKMSFQEEEALQRLIRVFPASISRNAVSSAGAPPSTGRISYPPREKHSGIGT